MLVLSKLSLFWHVTEEYTSFADPSYVFTIKFLRNIIAVIFNHFAVCFKANFDQTVLKERSINLFRCGYTEAIFANMKVWFESLAYAAEFFFLCAGKRIIFHVWFVKHQDCAKQVISSSILVTRNY